MTLWEAIVRVWAVTMAATLFMGAVLIGTHHFGVFELYQGVAAMLLPFYLAAEKLNERYGPDTA